MVKVTIFNARRCITDAFEATSLMEAKKALASAHDRWSWNFSGHTSGIIFGQGTSHEGPRYATLTV